MYTYSPIPEKKKEKILLVTLLVSAGALYAVSQLPVLPFAPAYLQVAAIFLLVGVVMVLSRSLLVQHTFAIVDREEELPPDFVITETNGRKTETVCRIGVDKISEIRQIGTKTPKKAKNPPKGCRFYRYTGQIFSENAYLVRVEDDEPFYLLILADETLIQLFLKLNSNICLVRDER